MCVFLGYAPNYKGYICYDVSKKRSYLSRHVVFNENVFPYQELVTTHQLSSTSSISPSQPSLPIVTPTGVVTIPISFAISHPHHGDVSVSSSSFESSLSIMISTNIVPIPPSSIVSHSNYG